MDKKAVGWIILLLIVWAVLLYYKHPRVDFNKCMVNYWYTQNYFSVDFKWLNWEDIIVSGADLSSFKPDPSSPIYAQDKSNVYCRWSILTWADVETFTMLDNNSFDYAKDKNNLYIDCLAITWQWLNLSEIKTINRSNMANSSVLSDGESRIYTIPQPNIHIDELIWIPNFKNNHTKVFILKDKTSKEYSLLPIEYSDSLINNNSRFKLLYLKSSWEVLFMWKQIPLSDITSFNHLWCFFSEDKEYYFIGNKKIISKNDGKFIKIRDKLESCFIVWSWFIIDPIWIRHTWEDLKSLWYWYFKLDNNIYRFDKILWDSRNPWFLLDGYLKNGSDIYYLGNKIITGANLFNTFYDYKYQCIYHNWNYYSQWRLIEQ